MDDDLKKYIIDIIEPALHFILIFTLIIGVPFFISGVWPPFVSILSESMEPNIDTGDMVFIVDNDSQILQAPLLVFVLSLHLF
jgi:hypothetical protein